MNVYVYQASLLCEGCGDKIKAMASPASAESGSSDHFPQGPYPDGGGEADCPWHCDACGVFLENPLTSDGYAYTEQAVRDSHKAKRADSVALTEWAGFYGIKIED